MPRQPSLDSVYCLHTILPASLPTRDLHCCLCVNPAVARSRALLLSVVYREATLGVAALLIIADEMYSSIVRNLTLLRRRSFQLSSFAGRFLLVYGAI